MNEFEQRHMYYVPGAQLDLGVMRTQAQKRATTFGAFGRKSNTTIHHHKANESCAYQEHEYYRAEG